MATEGRKQRERRPYWWRRRKSVYPGAVKTAVQKYVGKWPRRPGRLTSHNLAWEEKQKQADAFPSGAMAPRNTTQYLMELVYSDLNITAPSSSKKNYLTPKRKHMYSYISLDIDEDTMDFQYRDFESVFYQNEI